MNDNYKVYVHINKINGKVYVGQTKQGFFTRCGGDGINYQNCTKFWRAIQKYGWDNFEHILLEQHLTAEEADNKEKEYIQIFDAIDNGYNLTSGGHKNHTFSREVKERLKNSHLGQTLTQEQCNKISNALSGDKHYLYGKHIDYKTKIKHYSGGIRCIEINTEYLTLSDAAEDFNIDKRQISEALNGQQITAGGYHWQWIDKDKHNNITTIKKIQCVETGVIYPNKKRAMESVNSNCHNQLNKALKDPKKTFKGYHWRELDEPGYKDTNKSRKPIMIKYNNQELTFNSYHDCAIYLLNNKIGNATRVESIESVLTKNLKNNNEYIYYNCIIKQI